jgi:alpha-beta hydrolase superfamily lysophospholipase
MLCTAMAAAGAQTIELDGRRLAWRSIGKGPPLLLVNGYAATGGDWDPQLLQRLVATFEVISPDNRGMGSSELGDPAGLTIEGMAQDLERLLDALAIEHAPVVAGRWAASSRSGSRSAHPRSWSGSSCSRATRAERRPSPPNRPRGRSCSTTPAARASRRRG